MPGNDVDHIFIGLNDSAHGHQPSTHDDLALLVEHVGPDDEVGDCGFILDGDEYHAFGAAGPLPDQHQADDGNALTIPDISKLIRSSETLACIMLTKEVHRVRLQAEADRLIVVHDMLGERHRRKLSRFGFQAFVPRISGLE